VFTGEFTGNAGSVTGVKMKGELSIVYTGTGVYTFQYLENGVACRPGSPCRITSVWFGVVGLANTAQGGWDTNITTDNLNVNGSFVLTAFTVTGAAADAQGICKVVIVTEKELA
jgi:hypothetical protein